MGTLWYAVIGSGMLELVNESYAAAMPPTFTAYYLLSNVYVTVNAGFLGVMVGLIPAYFLFACKKESIEVRY